MPATRKTRPEIVDVLNPAPEEVVDRAPAPPAPVRPAPESQLTPEQRRIRDLENQLALERGRKEPDQELDIPTNPGDQDNILIHFLEDGFTASGQIWYRGQELEFQPGSPAHRDTFDRYGRSWLELRNNEFAQVDRWDKVMFRNGPWPGKSLTAVSTVPFESVKGTDGNTVSAPTVEELEAAQRAELRRRRAAPRLPAS